MAASRNPNSVDGLAHAQLVLGVSAALEAMMPSIHSHMNLAAAIVGVLGLLGLAVASSLGCAGFALPICVDTINWILILISLILRLYFVIPQLLESLLFAFGVPGFVIAGPILLIVVMVLDLILWITIFTSLVLNIIKASRAAGRPAKQTEYYQASHTNDIEKHQFTNVVSTNT